VDLVSQIKISMKKVLSLFIFTLFILISTAQVSKTIDVPTAGTLSTLLTSTELSTVTNLTVTGNIDARDVKCMRDNMPKLAVLDISNVNIKEYSGTDGTYYDTSIITYPANEMPQNSFSTPLTSPKISLKTITLPTTVISIGSNAFRSCSGLTGSLTLPNSISTIGSFAFTGCSGLSGSLIIPNSVNSLQEGAFYNCSSLNDVTIGNGLNSISMLAFYNCSSLKSVSFSNTVTTIGGSAFTQCTSLASIIIPNSISSISTSAFSSCSSLTTFVLESNNPYFSVIDGMMLNKNKTVLLLYPAGKLGSLKIPNTVTSINKGALSSCRNLTEISILPDNPNYSIKNGVLFNSDFSRLVLYPTGLKGNYTIPNSVTSIENGAFYGCTEIKILYCQNTTPPIIENYCFSDITLSTIYVPESAVSLYKSSNGWNSYNIAAGKQVTINNQTAGSLASALITAGYSPLSSIIQLTIAGNLNSTDISQIKTNMTQLAELDISQSTLTNNALPDNAFTSKTTLFSVKLPASLTVIGAYAFYGCTNLYDKIQLTPNLITIGASAFSGCTKLTGEITIPNSVTTLGASAFSGCSSLNGSLTISNNLTTIGASAFSGLTGLTGNLNIPNSVTSIGASAFYGCSGFKGNLNLGSGVKTIERYAFYDCLGLTGDLTIPNSVVSIADYAFGKCKGFNGNLTLPNSMTSLSDATFYGCSGFTGVLTIPNSITSINYVSPSGAGCFNGCSNFTELILNKNITSIGSYSFLNCSGLKTISIPRSLPPIIGSNTFGGINKETCSLNLPIGAIDSYQAANYWNEFIFLNELAFADNYAITLQIGIGGSVKENNVTLGNGSVLTAAIGSTKTFTFTPNAGYKVASVTYKGVDVTSQLVNNQYTTAAINANATLNVTFSKVIYRLSIKDASTGTVNLVCDYGATFNLDFTPSVGWKVSTIFYNNIDVTGSLVNGIYIVPPITDNSLLNVSFVTDSPNTAPEVINNNVKVYTTTSEIIIEGTSDGETIELYSINGKQIQTLKSEGERIIIPAQRDAVYLVKTAGKTFKVIL
jgi:hypothetical protein